jgi:hypothetical protein
MYRPFSIAASSPIDVLEAEVIQEKDGVHYISDSILEASSSQNLNSDFKNLVDSVIRPPEIPALRVHPHVD